MGDLPARLTPAARPGEVATESAAPRTAADLALDRFFERAYRRRPVQATFTGIHTHDTRLPDWSPSDLEGATADMRSTRRALDAVGRVDDDRVRRFPNEVDLALADGFLEIQIAEHESGYFLRQNPALWTGEAIFGVIALVTRDFAPLDQRLESAAARMRAIPAFLDDARRVLRDCPHAWRSRGLRECSAAVRLFGTGLPHWWSDLHRTHTIGRALFDDLQSSARAAGQAFDAFARWLESDLLDGGSGRTNAGPDLLGLLLRRGHWCATPIDTLLAEARDAMQAESAELERRARALTSGGWPAVQEQLAADHPAADDYLSAFKRSWHACREMAIARDLVTWPDAPIRYVPIPDHTRAVAPHLYYLFYRSPAPFDRLPVHDYGVMPVDVPSIVREQRTAQEAAVEQQRRLRAWNNSAIVLNHVIHHGGLGHHVQNDYATRSASRIGQVAAVDGASRIGMFAAGTLAEGWACYACDLAEEAGFLAPLTASAQQHTRVRLLARAIADLELHSGRRTLDETAALYREHAHMTTDAATAEAVKNSMFPGAAVMYWLGTRDLHALRRACQVRAGEAFSLRAFHDRVLSHGAIPVPLIARLMTMEPA